MSKFKMGGLTLRPDDIKVMAMDEEFDDYNWRAKAERLEARRRKMERRFERDDS